MWPMGGLTYVVVAPTGLAAFIVGGLMIHRLFQLYIEYEEKKADYWLLLVMHKK